jgi:para-nitrobenzyl esterase
MVWVHGGSFLTGSSAMPSYDGSVLAAEGNVVVVSINYRLGALGFAPVAGHSNLGLLDQLLALGWVREGIEAFGGDPDLVTVFGESAGGGSILHLLARPEARLLFRRAIVQSGATNLSLTTEQAGEVADRVRTALGGSDPVRAPVAAILEAQGRVLGELATVAIMAYHPVGTLEDLAPVDLLIGTTADEMRLFLDDASWTLGEAHFRKRAVRYLASAGLAPPEAPTLLAAYADLPTPTDQWAALRNDVELWLPTVDVATAHVERGATTYCYRFDWPAGVPNERVGACHGIDIPFTFGTLDRCGWDAFVGGVSEAEGLSVSIRGAWVAFATNGDPSTEGTGPWPAYGTPERATMVLDRENRLLGDPRGEVRRAWDVARSVPAP